MNHDTRSYCDKVQLEKALIDTIGRGAITPVFQPIVHLATGEISSFEVLARWQSEMFGTVHPSEFIPLAEKAGLIGELTAMIIRSACASALACEGDFRLAINISPVHFQQGEMPQLFEDSVAATGFPLARTQIEITESAVIDDAVAARATIDLLRAKGVRIVLDDFGTGFSSLTRLQALPFDKLKIDASFVQSIGDATDSLKIVSAVIGLGHSLGMPVVAEGVENEAQADMLKRLGCDLGQGWLFGRPVPASELPAILRTRGQRSSDTLASDSLLVQPGTHLDAAYDSAPVGLCFVDRNLRIVKANHHFSNLLERPAQIEVGHALSETFPTVARWLEQSLTTLPSPRHRSPRLPLPDGSATVRVSVAPVYDESGELLGFSLAVFE